jgi:hypothetical protein
MKRKGGGGLQKAVREAGITYQRCRREEQGRMEGGG